MAEEGMSLAAAPSARAVARLHAAARAAALFAAAVGVLVLVGWLFDFRPFMRVLPGQVAMVPNTAIGFILAGIALWWRTGVETRSRQVASRIAAAATGLLGFLALAEYFSGLDFGIDELLFQDRAGLTGAFPGRMALLAAISFVAIAVSLLLSNTRRARWAADALAVLPGLLSLASLASYAYGVRSIDWIGRYKGMAIHTAAAFLVLSLGILLSRGDRGFARLMVSDTARGKVARRILPVALVVPLVLGWLCLAGQRAGLYGTEFGTALYAVANAVVLLAIFWGSAAALLRTDQERQRVEEALEGSEQRYRDLATSAPVGIYRSTRRGRFVSVNAAFASLLGYDSIDEVLRLDIRRDIYFDNADRERLIAENEKLGEIAAFEVRLKRKDGSPVWVRLDARAIRGDGDRIEGFEGFVHDISESKRVEDALRASEQRLRAVMEGARDALVVSTAAGIVLEINRAAEALYGRPRAEVEGRHFLEMLAPEERVSVRKRFEEDVVRGGAQGQETVVLRADGKRIPIEVSVSRVEIGGEQLMFAIIRDISERKRGEEARARLAAIVEFSNDVIISKTLDGVITSWNASAERLYGYTAAEAVGQPEGLFVPEDRSGESAAILEKIRGGESVDRLDTVRVRKDGKRIDVSLRVSPVRDASGAVIGASAIARDITERLRVNRSLRESEQRYRSLFESMLHGFAHCEMVFENGEPRDFVYLDVNATFEEMTGLKGVIGKRVTEVIPGIRESNPELFEIYGRVARTGAPERFEIFLDALGVWLSISAYSPQKGHFVALFDDITERKRAEQALTESEDHYRDLVEHIHGLICTHDLEGRILSINHWAAGALGRTHEELLAMRLQDILAPEVRHEFEEYIARIRRDGVASGLMLVETAAGEKLIWEYHNTLRTEGVASPIVRGIARDITERRRADKTIRESEQRYRSLFESMLHGFALCEMVFEDGEPRDFIYLDVNANFEKLTGLTGVVGKRVTEVIPGIRESNPELFEIYGRVARTGAPESFEIFLDTLGIWFSISVYSPQKGHFVALFDDITERKRVEESLQKLQRAVEQAENVVFMTDPDGVITYVNPAFERVYGYSKEEVLGKTPRIVKGGRHDRAYYEHFWARLLAGESVREEFVNKRRNGELVTVEGSISPVLDARNKRIGFIAVQHDVTERKRSEEALQKSERRFSLAFHASPIPTIISEIETGRILDVNEQFLRVLGYSREEVAGKTSLEVGIWADSDDRDLAERRVRKEGALHDRITRIRTRSGEIREVIGSVVPIELGSVKCALWTFLDVTERREVERRIQERTTFLNALVEHSPLGILVLDPHHRVQMANPAFVSLFGYSTEDLQGRNPDDLIAPGDDALRAEAAGFTRDGLAGQPVHAVTARRRKDGALVEVEVYGVPLLGNGRLIGVYAIYQDLTERRQLEKQLIQAQKMEAVGQLAGGVAHDFNNLLTAILGYSDLVAAKLDPGSLEFEELDEVRKAGERAASLTRQLLAFSRQQVLERKVLDVNDLIADVEKMLRRLIGEDVQLTTVADPALRRVLADAGQLEQVVMNLAVNARDAMPRGGKLTIETANVELDEAYARQHVTVRPGSYVMIAVSDTGIGMNSETLAHIFEPFFTTKGLGKGTGLGLATVYGIVKQSGGYIWAYSEIGKGTTFKIYLPFVEEGAEAEPVRVPDPAQLVGSETVLLVEDEESVRVLSRSILERYGYTVLEAASGKDGLDVARQYSLPIDLLLTDVVMPEMGGPDLASRLEAVRPGVRVLYMSGYTDDAVVRHGLLEKGRMFLQKPFTPGALAGKVREALGN